jgi:dTDP-glucose 4,6-dehydratase
VSTDEVFGPALGKSFKENDSLRPTNPYAATKASGEFLVNAYFRSFGMPAIITRTMNMFGERQHPEKCVPLMIKKILRGAPVQIHAANPTLATGGWILGTRHWLHARNQANALSFLLKAGLPGEKYNIGGEQHSNLEIYQTIARTIGVLAQYEWAHPPGPIHDMDYSLDDSKIRLMGWKPPLDFETSLRETVKWTVAHPEWLED